MSEPLTTEKKAAVDRKRCINKLYQQHHRAYFDELYQHNPNPPLELRQYAGFRAWHDGYQAGLAAAKENK